MIKIINTGAKSVLPFSPAIKAGDFVYVSGQASVDRENGSIIEGTFELQTCKDTVPDLHTAKIEFDNISLFMFSSETTSTFSILNFLISDKIKFLFSSVA